MALRSSDVPGTQGAWAPAYRLVPWVAPTANIPITESPEILGPLECKVAEQQMRVFPVLVAPKVVQAEAAGQHVSDAVHEGWRALRQTQGCCSCCEGVVMAIPQENQEALKRQVHKAGRQYVPAQPNGCPSQWVRPHSTEHALQQDRMAHQALCSSGTDVPAAQRYCDD